MRALALLALVLFAAGCGPGIVFAGCAEIKAVLSKTVVVEVHGLTDTYVRVERQPGDVVREYVGVVVYNLGTARRVNANCNGREAEAMDVR